MSKRAAVPSTILKLSYPEDLQALANLGAPTNERLGEDDLKKVLRVAQASYDLWVAILENPRGTVGKKTEVRSPISGKMVISQGGDLRDLITLKVGAYYDLAIRILIEAPDLPRGTVLPPGFDWRIVSRAFQHREELKRGVKVTDERALSADFIAIPYLLGLSSTYYASSVHGPPWSMRTMEVVAQKALNHLVTTRRVTTYRYQKLLADLLIRSLLDYHIQYLSSVVDSLDRAHRSGVFSAIRLAELSLLATRADSVLKKYGRKHVEKVFEHQLSLIFQSFGLQVISTRQGRNTVDLFCLSSDSADGYSFMVEAKTTKGHYSLPPRDARALKEYANDITSALKSLPKLKFILIVAHAPAKTLAAKVTALGASIGVPVRFCRANQIAELREVIPGPVPASSFRDEILKSGPFLPDDFAARVARSYQDLQGAHVEFAEKLLSVHQGSLRQA